MPPKYTHLSQRNQILKRPGQHIGSTKIDTHNVWLVREERIVEEEAQIAPGLLHIFYEVLANAVDNYFNSQSGETPLKRIDVTVDETSGRITVRNDGNNISNTIHVWDAHEEKIDEQPHYEAEIIFGYLNSSSNYDDTETARIGGGLHGVGVKLTNIFSSAFSVECLDPATGLIFRQEYRDNMSTVDKPVLKNTKSKKGYTEVSYIPDFARFGAKGYTQTDLAIIKKMCIDAAMITGVKVWYNEVPLPVKSLSEYAGYYSDTQQVSFHTETCDVVLCEKTSYDAETSQVSFVNGISTKRGGVHVDSWRKAILTPLLEKIKAKFTPKGKGSNPIKLTVKNLEKYFMIFVNARLPNPEFDGQTKAVLTSPTPKTDVPPAKITSIMKWGFITEIEESIKNQSTKELMKTDGRKTLSVSIATADDAIKAGTVKSTECTLIIVEGLSAKTFAAKGISSLKNGNDYYGILPIRGKLLNVRGATVEQINNNVEITNIKQMLGLQTGVDYTPDAAYSRLRYGRVIFLTDADLDGDHIKGLLINYFHYFYPSLLSRGYLTSIRTPIVKITQGKTTKAFYNMKSFHEWTTANGTKAYTTKYYKGLGTSADSEIRDIFAKPVVCKYSADAKVNDTVNLVFSSKMADLRKRWLSDYTPGDVVYPTVSGTEQVPVSDFLNKEMIAFSIYDNKRSIPALIDGFKPSQRKALWAGFKVLNEKDDYKVAQFAGEVAKLSEYHHGEQSMQSTIIGMAQTFTGANNLTVFHESGQFGSISAGGADAASARYIFTHLTPLARAIFREEDDPILVYLSEEGKSIEPLCYAPIIPMILANGCVGIGTGYSTNVPSFNPLVLVEWIKVWLRSDDPKEYPELLPWYRGYTGTVTRDPKNKSKYIHTGAVRTDSNGVAHITALPVKYWTNDYKAHLDKLKSPSEKSTTTPDGKKVSAYDKLKVAELKEELKARELSTTGLKNELVSRLKTFDKENNVVLKSPTVDANTGSLISKWESHCTSYSVHFKVWPREGIKVTTDNPRFGLTSVESISNITLFNTADKLQMYTSLEEILREFCAHRLEMYAKRKEYTLKALKGILEEQRAKANFVKAVLDDPELLRRTEDAVFEYLNVHKYYKKDQSYRYLTDMPIRNITSDKYASLIAAAKGTTEKIDYITQKTPSEMWVIELDSFVEIYKKWDTALAENARQFMGA